MLTLLQSATKSDKVAAVSQPLSAQFEVEAETHLQRFLECWARIGALFREIGQNSVSELEQGDERKAVRAIFTVSNDILIFIKKFFVQNFIRDFDSLVELQKNYCFADQAMTANVRLRIKELVLNPFVSFSKRYSHECAELFETDRQLKYDAETVEMIIDRLFDASL